MNSLHPTFQQVTRQGTLFNQAVKGGPKPGGKKASKPKPKKGKKAMKKKAGGVVFRMSGDAENETDPKFRDVPKHLKKLWRETSNETKAKAGAATAGGVGAALLARKLLRKKAADDAGAKLKEVLEGATKQRGEVTGQAGDTMDPNDSSARYGGGLGNLKGARAPKFTNKVNPTDKPGVFRKMDKIASPFLSSFLDEFIKVSQNQAARSAEAAGVPESSRQAAMAREKNRAVSAKQRVGAAAAQSARLSSAANRVAGTAQKLEGTGLSAFGKELREGARKMNVRAGQASMRSMPDVAARNKAKKRYETLERMGPRAQ